MGDDERTRLGRAYSVRSAHAIGTLERLDEELRALTGTLQNIRSGKNLTLGNQRDELAQIYGTLDAMMCARIDAVTTDELTSGKNDARQGRKDLIASVVKLQDCVEADVKRVKAEIAKQGNNPQLPGVQL